MNKIASFCIIMLSIIFISSNVMAAQKVKKDKFFVPENSGTTKVGRYFLSVGDDSHKIFVHEKKGKQFIEHESIPLILEDAEAICMVKDFSNGVATIAIYANNSIIELSINADLQIINHTTHKLAIDKKIESLEFLPELNTYIMADRKSKGDESVGNGQFYFVNPYTFEVEKAQLVSKGKKPTDMHYYKGVLYVLHEKYIERYKFKTKTDYKVLKPIKLKKKVKDVESIVVTKKKFYIFRDKKK
jgi:hypothetical protein